MPPAAAPPDNRTLPAKEAGLFRQLAKQYEVGVVRGVIHGPSAASAARLAACRSVMAAPATAAANPALWKDSQTPMLHWAGQPARR